MPYKRERETERMTNVYSEETNVLLINCIKINLWNICNHLSGRAYYIKRKSRQSFQNCFLYFLLREYFFTTNTHVYSLGFCLVTVCYQWFLIVF